jgi:hypothetical protein
MTRQAIQDIVGKVREQISQRDPRNDMELQVGEDDVRIDGDDENDEWIYVCVTPAKSSVRPYDYAEMLSKITEDLNDQGYENVLLVPTLAEWNP